MLPSHAAARPDQVLQLPGDPLAGVGAKGSLHILHPRSEVTSTGTRVRNVVRERERLGDSVITSPPAYSKTALGRLRPLPVLRGRVDFASTFILERPSDDWLRVVPPAYV